MRVALASAIAGRRMAHQARVHCVLNVALKNAVFDQHRGVGRRAFIVDRQRTATISERAIVEHGHARGGNALSDPTAERRRTFAIEIAFEPVADRLVQQHTGPAGSADNGHHTRRRRTRVQLQQRHVHGFMCAFSDECSIEPIKTVATTSARTALLAFAIAFDDGGDINAAQRADVRGDHTIAAHHQHHHVFAGEIDHDLRHTRIAGTSDALGFAQQRNFCVVADGGERIGSGIKRCPATRRFHRD